MKRILGVLGAGLLLISSFAFAADVTAPINDINPTLILNHIKFDQSGESDGDEVYIAVTIYRANQPAQYLRFPEKPMHWTSAQVDKVKQMPIWTGAIKDGESVLILIDLMESDDSPLNPDDIIGTCSVKFKNNKGVLETGWAMPNRTGGPVSVNGRNGKIQKFMLVGEGAVYEMFLSDQLNPNNNGASANSPGI